MDDGLCAAEIPPEVITKELLADIFAKLWTFSTSVFGGVAESDQPPIYSGSATFVMAGEPCLLTAAHVWEALQRFDLIGLSLQSDRSPTVVRREFITERFVSQRVSPEWGPDLALLRLPDVHVSEISQWKAFYNLDRRRSLALSTPVRQDTGLWAVIGAAAEQATFGLHEAVMPTNVFASQILHSEERDGFDYLDLSVGRATRPALPRSYGGISGSGLWQIGLSRSATTGVVSWTDASLEGVAFYERFADADRGFIRCHGRGSIYHRALEMPASRRT